MSFKLIIENFSTKIEIVKAFHHSASNYQIHGQSDFTVPPIHSVGTILKQFQMFYHLIHKSQYILLTDIFKYVTTLSLFIPKINQQFLPTTQYPVSKKKFFEYFIWLNQDTNKVLCCNWLKLSFKSLLDYWFPRFCFYLTI